MAKQGKTATVEIYRDALTNVYYKIDIQTSDDTSANLFIYNEKLEQYPTFKSAEKALPIVARDLRERGYTVTVK